MSTYPPCEQLSRYLSSDSAPTVEQLKDKAGVKNADQIRHWRDGVRRPKPKHAVALEQATQGAVPRHVWYPEDWQSIWPEYTPALSAA